MINIWYTTIKSTFYNILSCNKQWTFLRPEHNNEPLSALNTGTNKGGYLGSSSGLLWSLVTCRPWGRLRRTGVPPSVTWAWGAAYTTPPPAAYITEPPPPPTTTLPPATHTHTHTHVSLCLWWWHSSYLLHYQASLTNIIFGLHHTWIYHKTMW